MATPWGPRSTPTPCAQRMRSMRTSAAQRLTRRPLGKVARLSSQAAIPHTQSHQPQEAPQPAPLLDAPSQPHPHPHPHRPFHPSQPSPTLLSRRSVLLSPAAAATAAIAATAAGPLVLASPSSAAAVSGRPPPELGFESRVEEFTLRNGLHVIVLPRRNAPVVACHTYANVGAWQESPGSTGMAHLLEHMAFKGTPRLGSRDFTREAPLLDALDEAFYELREAQEAVAAGGPGAAGPTRVSTLRSRFKQLQEAAAELAVPNAFGSALQRSGGVGLNATTSHDATRYFVSLPANKLELWVALEAERFRAPVFRELYSEKAVIEEERRLRVDNTPMGRYQQEYALVSLANPYRRPVIGFEQDFDAIGRRELQAFFDRYYGPANLTLAVVGDVEPEGVRRMVERYWADWEGPPGYTVLPRGRPLDSEPQPAASASPPGAAAGPPGSPWGEGEQDPRSEAFLSGSKTGLRSPARSGPAALLGFYRPALNSRQGVVLEVLADVLTGGRTSRMVSELVLTGRALSASVVPGYPGERHAGMALVYGVPREGESPEAVAALLRSQLASLVEGGVAPGELARVSRTSRAGLLAAAQSNSSMAASLAAYHVNNGSWRGLVSELDLVTQLRWEEVRSLAERVFAPSNCFEGIVLKA